MLTDAFLHRHCFVMWWSKAKYRSRYSVFISLMITIVIVPVAETVRTKMCPVLPLPEHGFFFSGYCEQTPGSLCGLGCLTGYRLVSGDSFRECRSDGTWTGRHPRCEEIRCSPLKINIRVIQDCVPKQNNIPIKFGTICRAKCNETGYRLVGPRTRECLIVGTWTGYDQFCIVGEETTPRITTSSTSTRRSVTTTTPQYQDYSNYALSLNDNDTGIILSKFDPSQFTIVFWVFLESDETTNLISLKEIHGHVMFEMIVQRDRLVLHYVSQNQTKTMNTLVNIPSEQWKHVAWTFSNRRQETYLFLDGARQRSIDFGAMSLDFENVSILTLFDSPFDGLITRLEVWKQIVSEQQLLVSYRDCRKQNGDVFSWSKVSDQTLINTNKLKSSSFCSGCSEPASIQGGVYRVSDYDVGSSVEYECTYGHAMIGASRAFCMVPSEWYPLPPICKFNPCTSECELCDTKTGVCLRKRTRINKTPGCDPPCGDDEVCTDGHCTSSNADENEDVNQTDDECHPPCPLGTACIHRRCEPLLTPYCPVFCRPGQVCVDGRCGCFKGLCERRRPCYEICEAGERCHNWSCSCGVRGKCGEGEMCEADTCMCGTRHGGCRPHEHCINGMCLCKTNSCDKCDNACKANEVCIDGKCVCNDQCKKAFCPFPCLNGGRCTGFYQCTCRQGWEGYRCDRRQRKIGTTSPTNIVPLS